MFLGEFEHTIDDKNRITIPSKFRGRLAAGVVITRGIDDCLWLYPTDAWEALAQKVSTLPLAEPNVREFRREVFSGASDSVPDKQGRVIVPAYLQEYAKIDKQAVIAGLYDHCEIWKPERWQERQQRSHEDPQRRAAQFQSLGI
jgi:MraZ protein